MGCDQTVLVVDDEQINRRILRKLLEDNYNVIEAKNGEEAWRLISQKRNVINAVLLDIIMPEVDGFAVLAKIRENRMEDLPVIVTTGVTDFETEEKALDEGAWDFVSKPYNAKILASRLRSAIARSKMTSFERIQYLSERDELTGFYNRRKMFLVTRNMLDTYTQDQFVFMRIDINHFALYNTSYGEKEGDSLLKHLAGCLQQMEAQFEQCVCGRINADVFCACIAYQGNQNEIIEKVLTIQSQIAAYRVDYPLEISAGICVIDDRTISIDDYFLRTSVAAQACKNQFEVYYSFYDETTGKKLASEITITSEMQNALDTRQFVVYFQPKVTVSTECACGSEALVRWMHPQKGMVSPGEFIPVFEKNGFIAKLDYYVWEEVCRLLKEWRDADKNPYPVSVNISRISLYNPKLVEQMTGLVKKYDIPPSLLQLEITESAYMTNPKLMEGTIEALHAAGFTILMDDFGSGYSSLNTLKRIQVDVLKIDMKFLPIDGEVEKGEIILTSVIKMAKWLGMKVVVEGVETKMQRDFLEGIGCDCIQGYYYSRPIPEKEYVENYVNTRNAQDEEAAKRAELEEIDDKRMSILIIDDNEFDRAILQWNFKDLYHIHECENVEEAMAYLSKHMDQVNLMLIDNILPGMSGMQFLRYCQRNKDLAVIPKIMITANDSVKDQVNAFNEGAYDYITKPLVKEVLVARVKHVMEINHLKKNS
ncbi:MAG: EAL domain-containing protein [Clostridia bacterium]|nr:EAL domain-containing protein [Clostridia bacterium]